MSNNPNQNNVDYSNNSNVGSTIGISSKINIKGIINRYLSKWYWYLLAFIVFIGIVQIYTRYISPDYKITSTLLIKDISKNSTTGDINPLSDLDIFRTNINVTNEIIVIKGKRLVKETIDELGLFIQYKSKGKFQSFELYRDDNPIEFKILSGDTLHFAGKQYDIDILNDFQFKLTENDKAEVFGFNTEIKRSYGSFTIHNKTSDAKGNILISLGNAYDLTSNYIARLQVSPHSQGSSVLEITLIDKVPQRGVDFINKLIENYDQETREDKNKLSKNTVDFINQRLTSLVS